MKRRVFIVEIKVRGYWKGGKKRGPKRTAYVKVVNYYTFKLVTRKHATKVDDKPVAELISEAFCQHKGISHFGEEIDELSISRQVVATFKKEN